MADVIGYSWVDPVCEDPAIQRSHLFDLGVDQEHIYIDIAVSTLSDLRPQLDAALRVCHPGEALALASLDRLAPSLPQLEAITHRIIDGEIILNVDGVIFDPANDIGRPIISTYLQVAAYHDSLDEHTRKAFSDDYGLAVRGAADFLRQNIF
jgi:hypothetical protein